MLDLTTMTMEWLEAERKAVLECIAHWERDNVALKEADFPGDAKIEDDDCALCERHGGYEKCRVCILEKCGGAMPWGLVDKALDDDDFPAFHAASLAMVARLTDCRDRLDREIEGKTETHYDGEPFTGNIYHWSDGQPEASSVVFSGEKRPIHEGDWFLHFDGTATYCSDASYANRRNQSDKASWILRTVPKKPTVPEWWREGWYVYDIALTHSLHIRLPDRDYNTNAIICYRPATLSDLAVERKGVKLWARHDTQGDLIVQNQTGKKLDGGFLDSGYCEERSDGSVLSALWDGPIIPHSQWLYLTGGKL